jgi:RHS repeat-associated protein
MGQVATFGHTWNGSSLSLTYTYNKDHQRSKLVANDNTYLPIGLTPGSATYTKNALNQYTAVGATAYAYDGRGNLTGDGVWTYGYDTENRLVSASNGTTTISYGYDALGRRLSKTVGGVSTSWASYGNREIAEYQGTGTPVLQSRTVFGAGLDEPVASISPTNVRTYMFQDTLGSVIALGNATGQVTEKYAYTAYGLNTLVGPGTSAYRYAGRRFEPETGLYHNRARAYSPTLGRFLQTDPIGTDGGINLYAYCANDPIDCTDPNGNIGQLVSSVSSGVSSYLDNSYVSMSSGIRNFYNDITSDFFGTTASVLASFPQVGMEIGWAGWIGTADRAADSTNLFRAVMGPELESIQSFKAFSNPVGIETKYFATSLEGAASYASQAMSAFGDGPFSFVGTSIPTKSITSEMMVTVDRGIQTIVVPTERLQNLSRPVILPSR